MFKSLAALLAVTFLILNVNAQEVGKKSNRVSMLSKAVSARLLSTKQGEMNNVDQSGFSPVSRLNPARSSVPAISGQAQSPIEQQQQQFLQQQIDRYARMQPDMTPQQRDLLQSLQQQFPQQMSQPMPQQMTQQMTQPMPQQMSQPMPQQMSQPMPQQMQQPMSQPMPQQMQQPMPQQMPQPMQQPMQQQMPQQRIMQSRTLTDVCNSAQPGDFLPHPSNSVQFIICYGFGEFTIMDCPENLIYNSFSQRCDTHGEKPMGCSSSPCLNNAKCVDMPFFQFKCECPSGFTGTTCEKIDSCVSKPCGDGMCKTLPLGSPQTHVCICQGGKSIGTSCQNAEQNPCLQPNSNLKLFSLNFSQSMFAHCEGMKPNFMFCQQPLIFNAAKQSCDWP